jgi:energy-coupling factor transporter ATP-binding protein EcfA2
MSRFAGYLDAAGAVRLPRDPGRCLATIEARGLTKRYGDKVAVDDLSFSIKPGRVTGFLGPNGAGKTTTMRMILGLDRPSAGAVTVNGKPFAGLYSPMREVGALLDAKAMQGQSSCRPSDHAPAEMNVTIPYRACRRRSGRAGRRSPRGGCRGPGGRQQEGARRLDSAW